MRISDLSSDVCASDLTVGAVFEIGIYDYDKTYVVMPMEDAQTLLLMGDSVGMIEVNTVDANRIGQILLPLAGKIGGEAVIADWRSLNAHLFAALTEVGRAPVCNSVTNAPSVLRLLVEKKQPT